MESVSTARRAPARIPKALLGLRADGSLAERAGAGDDVAFEVLYERHARGVLSFCRHLLGSLEEAEDAAQHAFAALHSELARSGGELRLRPWLYTVARNRCLSVLRARREQPDEAIAPQTAGLSDELERRADLRELLADLHDLPTDQRAALVLSELDDLSQAEIAQVLGTETAKVKGLVFRARSGLVERREARAASCADIREELATARRGALRRGRLRYHLRACPGCAAYLDQLRRQRRMMAVLLPVAPTVGLKRGVFAAVGLGGGAGAGAGVGGFALSKAVVVGAVAGTAAVGGGTVARLSDRDSVPRAGAAGSGGERPADAREPASGSGEQRGSAVDRAARRAAARALGAGPRRAGRLRGAGGGAPEFARRRALAGGGWDGGGFARGGPPAGVPGETPGRSRPGASPGPPDGVPGGRGGTGAPGRGDTGTGRGNTPADDGGGGGGAPVAERPGQGIAQPPAGPPAEPRQEASPPPAGGGGGGDGVGRPSEPLGSRPGTSDGRAGAPPPQLPDGG